MRNKQRVRCNDFLLREQDEDGGEGDAPKVPYTPPVERILATPDPADSMTEREASVDQKIDRYLLQYEKEAVPIEQGKSEESKIEPSAEQIKAIEPQEPLAEKKNKRTNTKLFRFLFEQPAPPAPDAGPPPMDTGGDEPPPDDMGGGGGDDTGEGPEPGDEAIVAPVPKINVRKFAEGIARLVNNYQTLVDPATIILNRAMYYVAKNYSPRLAKELMSILQRDFDLTPKSKAAKEAEAPAAPAQANTGPDNGGGPPSGGGGSIGGSGSGGGGS